MGKSRHRLVLGEALVGLRFGSSLGSTVGMAWVRRV